RAAPKPRRLCLLRRDHRLRPRSLDRGGRHARRRARSRADAARSRDPNRRRGGRGCPPAAVLPQRPRRRTRRHRLGRAVPARVPERNAPPARRCTANVEAKLADARRTLGIAWRYYDELEELGSRLLAQSVSDGEFERFLARLVPMPEPRPDATNGGRAVRNAERVREAIRTAYRTTPDLADIHGTAWGALQAVGAYVDHAQPLRRTPNRTPAEARFERATEPAPLKDRALELLIQGGKQ